MKHYHSPENVYIKKYPTKLIFLKHNELEKRIPDWLYYNSKLLNKIIKTKIDIQIMPVKFDRLDWVLLFLENK